MGLGLVGGGLSVTKWLYQQGAKITITDLRDKKTLAPILKKLSKYNIKYILGLHRNQDFSAKGGSASGGKNTDLIIKNPAVPINSPYLKIAKKYSSTKNNLLQRYVLKCIKKWGVKSLMGFTNEFDRGKQFVKIVKKL